MLSGFLQPLRHLPSHSLSYHDCASFSIVSSFPCATLFTLYLPIILSLSLKTCSNVCSRTRFRLMNAVFTMISGASADTAVAIRHICPDNTFLYCKVILPKPLHFSKGREVYMNRTNIFISDKLWEGILSRRFPAFGNKAFLRLCQADCPRLGTYLL